MKTEFIIYQRDARDIKFIGEVIGFAQQKREDGVNIDSFTIYSTSQDNIVVERKNDISSKRLVKVFNSAVDIKREGLESFGYSDLAKQAYKQAGLDYYYHA